MKVKLESTRAQTSSDLKNYQKELDAVESYMEQLTGSCTIKGHRAPARLVTPVASYIVLCRAPPPRPPKSYTWAKP
eukprot:5988800-Amphidinium_carterae.1